MSDLETLPTYDANAECYRNCYKSLYGTNPRRYPESDAAYAVWFAYYDTAIEAVIEEDREWSRHYAEMEEAAAREHGEALAMEALFPPKHYIPACMLDGW